MAEVTLRVLDGADRGAVYEDLKTPVTIGREEGNTVQLNDERISRFHVKIQDDQDKIVLTDLESTNGTKVNGEDIQIRVLRFGDVITLGRSVLLYGTREQIARRLMELRSQGIAETSDLDPEVFAQQLKSPSLDFELGWGENEDLQTTLHMPVPPDLPERLTPGQAAQVSEILEYFHVRVRHLVSTAGASENEGDVTLTHRQWQALIDLQAQLAAYLRGIGEPNDG